MIKTNSLKAKPLPTKLKSINMIQSKLFDSIKTLDACMNNSQYKNNTVNNNNYSSRMMQSMARSYAREDVKKYTGVKFYQKRNIKESIKIENNPNKGDDDFDFVASYEDPIAKLICKAKQLTFQNKQKIAIAKKQIKQQKPKYGTFLTGTGLYQDQIQTYAIEKNENFDVDPNQLLKQLLQKQQNDDLRQLRRMIKITNKNLNSYEKQIYQSSQGVMLAADHLKKQVDSNLMYKVNKIRVPQNLQQNRGKGKKSYSVNRIKDPKFS